MLKSVISTTQTPISPKTYQRILVAVDYLDSTPDVFRKALEMAKLEGGRLMIFHCLQGEIPNQIDHPIYWGPYAGIYSVEMLEMEEKLVQEAMDTFHAWLKEFVNEAKNEGIEAETEYGRGDTGKEICALAKEWKADLIVIGRSGKVGLSELVLGSVSNYVVHHAPCTVLVVQH